MCLDNSPRCVWVTHEKECVYSHLFVCSFEDKNRCVAVTHFVLECAGLVNRLRTGVSKFFYLLVSFVGF